MKNKAVISLLAILVIVLSFFAYLLSSHRLISVKESANKELNNVEQVSESDEIEDIERDLENTDLSNIDLEMSQIESEIDAALNEIPD